MENASKALIIAGAILLAILIITLGIMVYRQAAGVVNNNAMTEVEMTQFNEKFTQYGTSNVRGANVNALLKTIINNNIANANDSSKKVYVTQSGTNWNSTTGLVRAEAITQMPPEALSGKTYSISYRYPTQGLITAVTIQ